MMIVNHGTLSLGMLKTAPPLPITNPEQSKTAKMKVSGQKVSLQKDVDSTLKKFYAAWPYMNGAFLIPGMVKYQKINGIKLCKKLKVAGKPVVQQGEVKIQFKVSVPATNPLNGVTDPKPMYDGSLNLIPTHGKFKSA